MPDERPEKIEKRIRCGPVLFTLLVRQDNCYSCLTLLRRIRNGESFGMRDLFIWLAFHGVPFKMEFRPNEYEGPLDLVNDYLVYLFLLSGKGGAVLKKDSQGFFLPVSGMDAQP